jgi:GNAT superfamily N-acetyltransferase
LRFNSSFPKVVEGDLHMPDLLVKLYTLPPLEPLLEAQRAAGIVVRRAIAPEKGAVLNWVGAHFSKNWVSEVDVSFGHQPVGCFIAVENETLIGFGCSDVTARGFFGPTGVSEEARGRGTGKALLLACLHDMRAQGYGYGIIGGAGPVDFYAKAVGATVIEGSSPGMYEGMLRS